MPRRKNLEPHPRCYLDGESWTQNSLVPEPPLEAVLVQEMSRRFSKAMASRGWTIREAAKKLEISETTVFNLLHGKTWPEVPTIARIERNLGLPLWIPQHNVRESG